MRTTCEDDSYWDAKDAWQSHNVSVSPDFVFQGFNPAYKKTVKVKVKRKKQKKTKKRKP